MSIPRATTIAAALALILTDAPGHAEEPTPKASPKATAIAKPAPKPRTTPATHRAHERGEELREKHRAQRPGAAQEDDHDRD